MGGIVYLPVNIDKGDFFRIHRKIFSGHDNEINKHDKSNNTGN
jgi:hypothetical protein